MRKQLTPEQIAKRDARRARFRELWKTVAAMPEAERIAASSNLGFVNCEGHAFSLHNMLLLASQCPAGSVFGGFRQWLKMGRCVRKGEHGAMIWVPKGKGKSDATEASEPTEPDSKPGFIVGTVFDISQTDEIGAKPAVQSEELDLQLA